MDHHRQYYRQHQHQQQHEQQHQQQQQQRQHTSTLDFEKPIRQIHWSMSSEAERGEPPGKKAENGVHLSVSNTGTYFRENWATIFRVAELVLAVFCLGLVVDPVNYGKLTQNNNHHVGMIFTAFGGYIIITGVLIVTRIVGEPVHWKTSVIFSLIGTIVFTASGAIIISDWTKFMYNHVFHPSKHYMDMFISSGVFAIFSAAVYLLDAVFTYREEP